MRNFAAITGISLGTIVAYYPGPVDHIQAITGYFLLISGYSCNSLSAFLWKKS